MRLGALAVAIVCVLAVAGCSRPAEPVGITATTSERASPVGAGPFAGSPAETYPRSAAGITLPAAQAVRGFTAAEVNAALHQVRAGMIAARLDETMLVDREPAGFLKLLAPANSADLATWFADRTHLHVATWIAPTARLDPAHLPRVSGRVTYLSRRVEGYLTLQVTTNFVWVYAFDAPGSPIAAVHDEILWEFTDPRNVEPSGRGMWIADVDSYVVGMDCDEAEQGMLAPGPPGGWDYLRPEQPLDIEYSC